MKLSTSENTLEVFGAEEAPSNFSIAFNSKAFKVLSSTLYSNKIGSIVREYASNAWDSHIMAGKTDTPFEIHLPNAFEPWFSIEDFGIGLSKEDVLSTYTVFFKSTKDQSNDCVGMLGLGSKSAFSYTDQFTITSKHSGVKTVYSAFISQDGVPSVVEMHSEPTGENEPNGVEIRMSVKREDFNRFSSEVIEQLKYFKVKPILKNSNITFPTEDRVALYTSNNCSVYSSGRYKNFVIIQGNVGYSLDINTLEKATAAAPFKNAITFLNQFSSHDVEFVFPIGSIGVTASREGVEYDDKTVTNICKAIEKLETDYLQQLKERISTIPTDWEKILELQKDGFNLRFVSAFNFAPQFKFARHNYLLDLASVIQKTITEDVEIMVGNTLEKRTVTRTVPVATVTGVSPSLWNNRRTRTNANSIAVYPVDKVVLIGRDKHTLAERKLQYFFNNNKGYTLALEIRSEDGTDLKVIIDKLKALMGVDVKVVMLSEIVLPEEIRKPTVRNGATQYYQYRTYENSIRKWNPVRDQDLTEVTDEVFYITHDGAYVDNNEMSQAITYLKHLDIEPQNKLIAISSKKEALIIDKSNFVNLHNLKKKAAAVLESQKARLVKEFRILAASSALNNHLREIKFLDSIAIELPESDLAKIFRFTRAVNHKVSTKEAKEVVRKKLEAIGVNTESIDAKIHHRVNKFCATIHKYPLLPVLSNWYCRDHAKAKDVVQYVKALNATF